MYRNVELNKHHVRINQIHDGWFTLGAYHDANEYWVLNGALDDVRGREQQTGVSGVSLEPPGPRS